MLKSKFILDFLIKSVQKEIYKVNFNLVNEFAARG